MRPGIWGARPAAGRRGGRGCGRAWVSSGLPPPRLLDGEGASAAAATGFGGRSASSLARPPGARPGTLVRRPAFLLAFLSFLLSFLASFLPAFLPSSLLGPPAPLSPHPTPPRPRPRPRPPPRTVRQRPRAAESGRDGSGILMMEGKREGGEGGRREGGGCPGRNGGGRGEKEWRKGGKGREEKGEDGGGTRGGGGERWEREGEGGVEGRKEGEAGEGGTEGRAGKAGRGEREVSASWTGRAAWRRGTP